MEKDDTSALKQALPYTQRFAALNSAVTRVAEQVSGARTHAHLLRKQERSRSPSKKCERTERQTYTGGRIGDRDSEIKRFGRRYEYNGRDGGIVEINGERKIYGEGNDIYEGDNQRR